MQAVQDHKSVLVTGATGYVGGRLIPQLLASGVRVNAMGRSVSKMACRPWASHPGVTLLKGDVLDRPSLVRAAQGCRAAYYLVHSMVAQKGQYADADRQGAHNMVHAAAQAGLEKIIYLGGLGEMSHANISPHLKSRHEVGEILQAGPVPTTILRAAMILGSGSASFEILRYLVERLPVMITPRWVHTACQPISIRDVLDYLEGCLGLDAVNGQTFDIGGPDILTYAEIIQIYAQETGLPPRRIFPVPVLTPKLSAYWIHLVTPLPAAIAQPLAQGLSVPVTCQDNRILELIPLQRHGCRDTIRRAMQRVRQKRVDTCWFDAGALIPPEWTYCGDADYAGGTILECGYRMQFDAQPDRVWDAVRKIGGQHGWYYGNFLWRLRGVLDKLVGGVGLRRGRRDPEQLLVGDALDFWRVLEVEDGQRLVLLAEMKTPGEAMLDIQIKPLGEGRTEVQLLSRFLPRGLAGLVYWYVLYPFHQAVFSGMLKALAAASGAVRREKPQRFTPKLYTSCTLPPSESQQ